MPGHPHVAPSVASVKGSVYTALAHRLAAHEGEVYPLHIGDTWMEPAAGCRMEDLSVAEHPGMHRYAPVTGLPRLVDAIVERTRARTGVRTERGHVLISAGATGALGAVGGAIVAPGDEVLILAPFWPLIAGIVRSFHGEPVPVPFIGEVDGPEAAVEAVEAARTSRTVALYLNTPNNPTGRVIPSSWIAALVEWARAHDLWLISDEVYEDYQYRGAHTYVRAMAPERTFSAYSFSKGFGMSGNRCGYVVGPEEAMPSLAKVSTHTFYSTPTASQLAAMRVLDGPGDVWVAEARAAYERLGNMAAERLGVERPEGSTFLFVDVADHLGPDGIAGFLERCVDRGLFMAPGTSFGPYPTHVRVCFTSAPPPVVERGIGVFAELLGR